MTLSHDMFGPDVSSSVTVDELTELVRGAWFISTALAARSTKTRSPPERWGYEPCSHVARSPATICRRTRSTARRLGRQEARLRHPPARYPNSSAVDSCATLPRIRCCRWKIWRPDMAAKGRSASSSPLAPATAASRPRCGRSRTIRARAPTCHRGVRASRPLRQRCRTGGNDGFA